MCCYTCMQPSALNGLHGAAMRACCSDPSLPTFAYCSSDCCFTRVSINSPDNTGAARLLVVHSSRQTVPMAMLRRCSHTRPSRYSSSNAPRIRRPPMVLTPCCLLAWVRVSVRACRVGTRKSAIQAVAIGICATWASIPCAHAPCSTASHTLRPGTLNPVLRTFSRRALASPLVHRPPLARRPHAACRMHGSEPPPGGCNTPWPRHGWWLSLQCTTIDVIRGLGASQMCSEHMRSPSPAGGLPSAQFRDASRSNALSLFSTHKIY